MNPSARTSLISAGMVITMPRSTPWRSRRATRSTMRTSTSPVSSTCSSARKSGRAQSDLTHRAAPPSAPGELPITDATPQRPTSPYGITKMAGEHYLRSTRDAKSDFTALRTATSTGRARIPTVKRASSPFSSGSSCARGRCASTGTASRRAITSTSKTSRARISLRSNALRARRS